MVAPVGAGEGASARAAAVVLVVAGLAGSMLLPACASAPPQPPQQAQLAQAVSPPARRGPPEPLSNTARAILRSRMGSHARDMQELVGAIMALDYDRIDERARAIAADASLARPLTGDATELASTVPAKFFDLQDEQRAQARALAAAAQQQDALGVADTYGKLSGTCVRCHATYREGKR